MVSGRRAWIVPAKGAREEVVAARVCRRHEKLSPHPRPHAKAGELDDVLRHGALASSRKEAKGRQEQGARSRHPAARADTARRLHAAAARRPSQALDSERPRGAAPAPKPGAVTLVSRRVGDVHVAEHQQQPAERGRQNEQLDVVQQKAGDQ